jgi:hypothetical protein
MKILKKTFFGILGVGTKNAVRELWWNMKNQCKKQIDIAFKVIALLCLSIFFFFCSVHKQKITVYLRPESIVGCPDTLVIKNIDLSIKKKNKFKWGVGCLDGTIYGKLVIGTDTLLFACLPITYLYLKEGEEVYETTVDTLSLRRLNDIIMSSEPSEDCPNFRIFPYQKPSYP